MENRDQEQFGKSMTDSEIEEIADLLLIAEYSNDPCGPLFATKRNLFLPANEPQYKV